jgi:glycosyltransferase involved in cell wall biosynthesis
VAAGALVNGKGPLVSFVIPAYNYADFVGRALDSLLIQTVRDIEIIVIDDASTDDTPGVLERYRGDSRVWVVRHGANRGNIRTYNEGLAMARSTSGCCRPTTSAYVPTRSAVRWQSSSPTHA